MFDATFETDLFPSETDERLYQLTLGELDSASCQNDEPDSIPTDLANMAPGPFLAAILASIDLSRLSGCDIVTVMQAQNRQRSHHEAGLYASMVEVAHSTDPDTTDRSSAVNEYAIEEIGAALTLTRRTATNELGLALDMSSRIAAVGAALAAGDLDGRKARVFSQNTDHLEAETARTVVRHLIDDAPDLTTGQLAARLRRLCMETNPNEAAERYEQSLSERRVVDEPNPEGTAALMALQCAPDRVYAARDFINRLARKIKTQDDPRTIDQIRADVMMDLLTGQVEGDGWRGGSVDMHVDLNTLAELEDMPGELAGYGPVVAEVARKVAREQTDGEWTATVTDPETGEPLHTVAIRRRPSAAQKRKIRAYLPTCSFPGCRMPALNSDLDHLQEWARGGPTTVANHAPLCRRHHLARHRGGWHYEKIDKTRFRWTSPLGHNYVTGRPP